jgi:hypothetical protein
MRSASIVLGLLVAACGGDFGISGPGPHGGEGEGEGECTDHDGDGYGLGDGCTAGDCNDAVGSVHAPDECAAFCDAAGDIAPGCACGNRQVADCYTGPEGTDGVASCQAGRMTCGDGVWGACDGEVAPAIEQCNSLDDDCDGETDEGVLSACGTCDLDCDVQCVGLDCNVPFDPDAAGARSVVQTEEGGLTLDERATVLNRVIWVANSGEGTVSKIDTTTRLEVSRFWTGWSGASDNPSRTTVNPNGDVVVCNRGPGGEATKYLASDCPDVNGNGVVDTSTGRADVRAFQTDECWAWTTPVGAGARGAAIELREQLDGSYVEYVWIGDYTHMDVHELDSETGAATGRTVAGVSPYGLALDPFGKLWTFSGAGTAILSIDTETLATETIALPAGEAWYGITVDHLGRVWVGGTVARYDPATATWASPGAHVCGGGLAVDAEGNAWVGEGPWGWAGYCTPSAWKVDADTLEATEIPGAGGHGWAIDFDGFAWSIGFVGDSAYVVDPDTLAVEVVRPPFVSAYTYSDMTGFQLLNTVDPVGSYPHLFEGCDDEITTWGELAWDATVPEGTSISFTAQTANDPDALLGAAVVDLGAAPGQDGPVDVGAALESAGITAGRLVLVEATLRSDSREDAPVLDRMSLSRSCPPEIE